MRVEQWLVCVCLDVMHNSTYSYIMEYFVILMNIERYR